MASQHTKALSDRFLNKRVKRSWRSLRTLWDRYHSCGTLSRKNALKAEFDKQSAERGTVVKILEENPQRGVCAGLEINWDAGYVSKCLPYMVDIDIEEI